MANVKTMTNTKTMVKANTAVSSSVSIAKDTMAEFIAAQKIAQNEADKYGSSQAKPYIKLISQTSDDLLKNGSEMYNPKCRLGEFALISGSESIHLGATIRMSVTGMLNMYSVETDVNGETKKGYAYPDEVEEARANGTLQPALTATGTAHYYNLVDTATGRTLYQPILIIFGYLIDKNGNITPEQIGITLYGKKRTNGKKLMTQFNATNVPSCMRVVEMSAEEYTYVFKGKSDSSYKHVFNLTEDAVFTIKGDKIVSGVVSAADAKTIFEAFNENYRTYNNHTMFQSAFNENAEQAISADYDEVPF